MENLKPLFESFLNLDIKESINLEEVSNIDKLISYWKNTSSDSKPEELIEARMVVVLEEVSEKNIEDIPDWFIGLLKNEVKIPNFLKEKFKEKAKSIYRNF